MIVMEKGKISHAFKYHPSKISKGVQIKLYLFFTISRSI
jgi:hypothetical protein